MNAERIEIIAKAQDDWSAAWCDAVLTKKEAPPLAEFIDGRLCEREKSRMRSREICNACQEPSPIGFHVPDDVWAECVPRRFEHSPLCIRCFARYGDEAGVAWDRHLTLFPVSLVTHLLGVQGPDTE